jgi:hypothetical protein
MIRTRASNKIFLVFFAGLVISVSGTQQRQQVTEDPSNTNIPEAESLIDWVRANGGYYDDSMVIKNVYAGNHSLYRGVFAKKNIEEGQKLSHVPWRCLIGAWNEDEEEDEEEEEEDGFYDAEASDTIFNLDREMKLGSKSFFAPYIDILRSQRITVPSAWSLEGRELLEQMLGDYLPPSNTYVGIIDWFVQEYGFDTTMTKSLFIMMTRAMQSSTGTQWLMVPVMDSFNHIRDQARLNTLRTAKSGVGFELHATKFIPAGSEIFVQYHDETTSYIFQQYGFVEPYPHRFQFELADLTGQDIDVWLTPRKRKADGSPDVSSGFRLEFSKGELANAGMPNTRSIRFFRRELARIEMIEKTHGNSWDSLSKTESGLLRDYYEALRIALKEIIVFGTSEMKKTNRRIRVIEESVEVHPFDAIM